MNNRYSILGASALTPYTTNRQELHRTAIRHTATEIAQPNTYPRQQLTQTDGLFDFIPKKKLRRIDRFSRLSLYASCLALDEAGLWGQDLTKVGISMASNFGAATTTFKFLDSFLDSGDRLASPTHFSSSLHNAAPSYISLLSGIHGPAVTTSNADLGCSYAFLQAMQWLDAGVVEHVVVGGVEEYSPVLEHCLTRLALKEQPQYCGEGAAFFVLSKKSDGLCFLQKPTFSSSAQQQVQKQEITFIAPQHNIAHTSVSLHENSHSLTPLLSIHPSALALCLACAVEQTLQTQGTSSAISINRRGTSSLLRTEI